MHLIKAAPAKTLNKMGVLIGHIIFNKRSFLLSVAITCFVLVMASPQESDTTNEKSSFKNLIAERNIISGRKFTTPLNPQTIAFTQDYIRKQGKELDRMKVWAKPYFNLYDAILPQYGVPKELKYLSVIESHLQSNLVSWAGAVGPWQLMGYEAKRFGLRTGMYFDERTDYSKSTHVAAKLLKELYDEFGDWLLVVAAYNGGAGRVKQAINFSGSRDFWKLQYLLKEETRNHVKKYIATHYLFEGGGGLTTMTAAETKQFLANQPAEINSINQEELANTAVMEISGRYNSLVICNNLLMDIDVFNKWNPGFDKELAEGRKYNLRIAKEKVPVFEARKNEMLLQSIHALLDGSVRSAGTR